MQDPCTSFLFMDKIIVEDRTTETPQQILDREVLAAAQLIAGFTIHVSRARPPVGLGALSYVLGMGTARTGADIEEVLALIRQHYDGTQAQMARESDGAAARPESEDESADESEDAEDRGQKFDA